MSSSLQLLLFAKFLCLDRMLLEFLQLASAFLLLLFLDPLDAFLALAFLLRKLSPTFCAKILCVTKPIL